jgi:hypothetical protein
MSLSGTARNSGTQQLHFMGKDVTIATVGIGTSDTVKVGRIPAGSRIQSAQVHIVTAFNAGTTNVLTVGTSSGSNADIVGAAELAEGSTGATVVLTGAQLTFASDTDIYVKYTQTGTAATTGAATILISYFPPNW